MPKPYLSKA